MSNIVPSHKKKIMPIGLQLVQLYDWVSYYFVKNATLMIS